MAAILTRASKFVKHEPCPKCGSSDALARYSNGSAHCFSSLCDHHEAGGISNTLTAENIQMEKKSLIPDKEARGVVSAIDDRRIPKETCEKYGVTVQFDASGNIETHFYPYRDIDSKEVKGFKKKTVKNGLKQFSYLGSSDNVGFFGQETCSGKGKYLTLCEGELDCLSIAAMFDNKWEVCSLRSGAGSASQEIKAQLEWLEGYDSIVLCFDTDKAGQAAVDSVKDLFSPNKLKICTLPEKDASEMLQKKRIKEFNQAWWNSRTYQPDGIVSGDSTWDAITNKMKVTSIPYPWAGLNEMTHGFRLNELVTITSGTGMGKSQLVREIEHYLLSATNDNIGVIALEEDIARTALGLMSIEADCPLHLEENLDSETIKPFWENTLGTGRYFLYDHWGSTSEDKLLARIRYMAKALDCKWVILDHLSIVVSGQQTDNERKAIDTIVTNLRTLVQELGIGMFLVSHLRRTVGKSFEEGSQISLNDIRGSSQIAGLSDIVLGLQRSQQHECEDKRNTTTVRVLKNRYTGETGASCYLKYNRLTGRMTEVANPEGRIRDSSF